MALLEQLPRHIATWGTGILPISDHTSTARTGDGLEVLDLGNCSLPFSVIKTYFLGQDWPQLRSVTLHNNPLAVTNPDYAELLRDSDRLPKLQIIDAKRVVERKRKGEVQESKMDRRRREKKEKRRMTGANAGGVVENMRIWGGRDLARETGDSTATLPVDATALDQGFASNVADIERKKRKRPTRDQVPPTAAADLALSEARSLSSDVVERIEHKKRKRSSKPQQESQKIPTTESGDRRATTKQEHPGPELVASAPTATIPSQSSSLPKEAKRKSIKRTEGGKVETIRSSAGGVDLKKVFVKPTATNDTGSLGLGGW